LSIGPAYRIPAFWVPPCWVTHYVTFLLLLRRWTGEPAAGENAGSLHDFMSMISAGAIDIAQPDVAKTGL
jgi:hypothetical protein